MEKIKKGAKKGMSRFKNEAESIKDEIIGIRRSLHENPEIGYE